MNYKILILDDDPRPYLIEDINGHGKYDAVQSTSINHGKNPAIHIYQNYDLIICDINLMHQENGFSFYDQIKDTYRGNFFFFSSLSNDHADDAKKRNVPIYSKDINFLPVIEKIFNE